MLKSLFILTPSGDVLIEKHWRGLIGRNITDYFWQQVSKCASHDEVPPVMAHSKYSLVHIQNKTLFYLAVVQSETPPLLIVEFLYRILDIFQSYFNDVSEESLKENFTVVYQLLEEMMDDGIPFCTELNTLQDMIHSRGVFSEVMDRLPGDILPEGWVQNVSEKLPESTASIVPWRRVGVKYTTNEIYLDIIEDIDCLFDANQLVVNMEVHGVINVSCKLSGMPDLSLTFVNARLLDDVRLHPCVRFARWEQNKVISFIPPDGNFELLKYRAIGQPQVPIYCKPQISFSEHGGRVTVMVGTKNNGGKPVEAVIVTIPFPKNVSTANLTATYGSVVFDDVTKVAKWDIGKIPRDSPMLQGSVSLQPGSGVPEANPTLAVDFKVVMLSSSGIKVDGLAIHNESYKPWKGVRYITKNGKFQVRS